ncbi:MAG: glycosyltransferase family 39 protein [Blastocatellales bacterium]
MSINTQPSIITCKPLLASSHDWKKDFYLWLPLACVSWWLAWKFQDRFISDWDGFDYTGYTVEGKPSALGLGRALFLGYNYLLWRVASIWFNWPPEQAYLLLRYGVIAQTGLAITGIYALFKELTANRLATFFGTLMVVASPYFITYSGRAMSEIPGFLMLSWSLWWMLRSLRLHRINSFFVAAFLVGLSANVREFAIFYFPVILLAARFYGLKWREGIAALALASSAAFAGMIFWILHDGDLYLFAVKNWYRLSAAERKVHPVTIRNFGYLARFAFNCSATAAMLSPMALIWLSRNRRLRMLLLFGQCGLLADLVLLVNHDLPVNPRYLMTGLLGLAAACGWCLAELFKLRPMRGALVLLSLIILTKATYNHEAKELYSAEWNAHRALEYVSTIENLPWNSGFLVGYRTPLIHFYARIGVKPYWKTISPGANWPDGKLEQAIDDFFLAGRIVYVDFDPQLWQSGERASREAAGLEMIRRRYELEHISDQFYRIVKKKPEKVDLFAQTVR